MKRKILYLCLLAAAILLGCAGCGDKREKTIRIATKPMTEQLIIGEMLGILIEATTDLDVAITHGVGGGTSNIHPALVQGEFDLYPEYTGTAWQYVLKKESVPEDEVLFATLTREYEDAFGLEWVGMYGFNNTYGLAARRDIAERYGVRTFSDLARVAGDLVFGAEYDFYERDDGFRALCDAYGLTFRKRVDLDIGLKYQALRNKQIDVMNVFTTDGQLSSPDVALLEDDKGFYQTYHCGTVVRKDTLRAHPELRETLMLMHGILNGKEMAKLNHAVEVEGRDSREVALGYLRSKGLVGDTGNTR